MVNEQTPIYGEECLLSLVPKAVQEKIVPKRYTSKFRSTITQETKFNKHDNKTMGPAKVLVRTPEDFLKKTDGSTAQMPRPPKCKNQRLVNGRKPNVPRHNDQNLVPQQSNKDFIKANAVENITSVPRKPKLQYVDTNTGKKNDLISSGLVPRFTLKKEYGKLPEYLKNRNEQVQHSQDCYDAYVATQMKQNSLEQVNDNARDYVLTGLKSKWEELHHQYQGLSVITDTAPKKNIKERMEAQMSQLERDIDRFERYRSIYVSKGN